MGHDGVWVGLVVFFLALGLAAFLFNWQDINIEKEDLENWDKYVPHGSGRSRKIGEQDLCRVFNQYTHAAAKSGVQKSGELAQLLTAKKLGTLHLLEERLLTITSLVRESNNVRIMPDVSEMHDLSLQSIESKWATKLLNMSVNCVLVCGICGTLWSVHAQLFNAKESDLLTQLGACLLPSMVAVLVNIILVFLRNANARKLDLLLEKLDERTITQFIPALQPESNLEQSIGKFESAIAGTPDDPRMGFFANAPKQLSELIKSISEHTASIANGLRGYVSKLKKLFSATDQLRKLLKQQSQDTEELAKIAYQLNENAQALTTGMQETQATIRQFRAVMDGIPFQHPGIKQHADNIERAAAALKVLSALPELVREWKHTYNGILTNSSRHINFYKRKTERVSQLVSETTPICDLLAGISTSMKGFQTDNSPLAAAIQAEKCIRAMQKAVRSASEDLLTKMDRTCEIHTKNIEETQKLIRKQAEKARNTTSFLSEVYASFTTGSKQFKGKRLSPTTILVIIILVVLIILLIL